MVGLNPLDLTPRPLCTLDLAGRPLLTLDLTPQPLRTLELPLFAPRPAGEQAALDLLWNELQDLAGNTFALL
ncbi:MAG: hypothetical protein A2Y38_07815 [Spirochaetes bacterium GWB1_59_5]|nr:MAG: hypothetical protein A2Y38_07815 [Spirochaetes bacterium GWB1_59_5]